MSVTMEPYVPPDPPGRHRRALAAVVPPALAFAVLFGSWELFVRLRDISPLVLPAPTAIWGALSEEPSYWWDQALVTGTEALLGLVVATVVALGIAVLMSHFRAVDRALGPVVTMVQVTPVIALATPLVIWLGFGLAPKVVMAALITFVPLVVNAATGLRAIDPMTEELLRSVAASRREVFWKLRVPHALPYLFSALRVCVGLALIGALVAEWFGSTEGLGRTMNQARNSLAITKLWAAVAVLMVMGIAATAIVRLVERWALRWHTET
ncbi:ABC transporter permease [Actinomarinicola tropica]|uniref:ABC transporter permease subunit n=1 Tax=Actinomarinicola tropica TaxID=2789776 RepID=A0A5Q2RKF2_9ACTN|nr:ABC transporter permease [Actinomarinicola tropica]QGG94886.1 ABC transporter permease subunit [Actinomarinicola tropica]